MLARGDRAGTERHASVRERRAILEDEHAAIADRRPIVHGDREIAFDDQRARF